MLWRSERMSIIFFLCSTINRTFASFINCLIFGLKMTGALGQELGKNWRLRLVCVGFKIYTQKLCVHDSFSRSSSSSSSLSILVECYFYIRLVLETHFATCVFRSSSYPVWHQCLCACACVCDIVILWIVKFLIDLIDKYMIFTLATTIQTNKTTFDTILSSIFDPMALTITTIYSFKHASSVYMQYTLRKSINRCSNQSIWFGNLFIRDSSHSMLPFCLYRYSN